MRPFIALATLAATAAYVYAQDRVHNVVARSAPLPGATPDHDPSRGFAGFVAENAVPRRGCAPSAEPPRPGQVDQQRAFQQGGCVEILSAEAPPWAVGGKSLADTLTLDRRGRVWWDYAREIDSVVSWPRPP